jgi:hypothetical protein
VGEALLAHAHVQVIRSRQKTINNSRPPRTRHHKLTQPLHLCLHPHQLCQRPSDYHAYDQLTEIIVDKVLSAAVCQHWSENRAIANGPAAASGVRSRDIFTRMSSITTYCPSQLLRLVKKVRGGKRNRIPFTYALIETV